uniref:S-triazine hydrolase n=1 Tax=Gordonia rubripertincta TaxID=36822 RepID=TRZA_GORRU|nr:RecName: Full=S-triazine hydrolase; AltName: Full=N-ethylammeline chlorohydrolase [Gordonia rubripertincta]AAA90931.1 N-ethylammeline chlorohydrolase [Gordonia rubripertincta]
MTRIAITGGRVLTMDPERRVLEPGTVVVEDQFIAQVGSPTTSTSAAPKSSTPPGWQCSPASSTPTPTSHKSSSGVVHPMTATSSNGCTTCSIPASLPTQTTTSESEHCCTAPKPFVLASPLSSTTRTSDPTTSPAPGPPGSPFTDAGIRAIYARMYFDAPRAELEELVATIHAKAPGAVRMDESASTDHVLADLDQLITRHDRTADGRIRVWPAPAIPFMVSEKGMKAAQEIAASRTDGWTMHVSEDPIEARVHSMNAPEYLHHLGCLDDRLLAAHCVHIDSRDIRLFRQHDVKISTQPVSNSYLAAGIAPVPEMLAHGVTVGIGTDDANCNDSVNLISDMKVLALIHRAAHRDASIITPEKIIEMATIDGARCIGMADQIGSLEAGKRADIITLDLRHAQTTPAHDLAATIVFQAYGNEVNDVLVNGSVVMRDRVLSFLPTPQEEKALYDDASERSAAMLARAGLTGTRTWQTLGS